MRKGKEDKERLQKRLEDFKIKEEKENELLRLKEKLEQKKRRKKNKKLWKKNNINKC